MLNRKFVAVAAAFVIAWGLTEPLYRALMWFEALAEVRSLYAGREAMLLTSERFHQAVGAELVSCRPAVRIDPQPILEFELRMQRAIHYTANRWSEAGADIYELVENGRRFFNLAYEDVIRARVYMEGYRMRRHLACMREFLEG